MDQILGPYLAAGDDTLLSKISALGRRCMDTVVRSRVCIARSEQRIVESNRRTNGHAIAPQQRSSRPDNGINRPGLREQVRATRARSELLLRQTRNIIARSRALLIEPI